MVRVLITLASILAITKGYPRCFLETHSIKCQFSRKTKEAEIVVRNYFDIGSEWEDLINCWSDKMEECCRKSECFNTSDMVNITIDTKGRTGKIGCMTMPDDFDNNSFCKLSEPVLTQSPPLTRDSTVLDKVLLSLVIIMIIIIPALIIIIIILCRNLRKKNNRCDRSDQGNKDINENIHEKDKCLPGEQEEDV